MTIIQTMRDAWGVPDGLPVTDEHRKPGARISTYHFAEALASCLSEEDILTTGSSGLATEVFLLSVPIKPERQIISSWSLGSMGFGPPIAIGACIGSGYKRTICVDGDGGFQLNVQELATVRGLDLPIKFFILNNSGYASMRVSMNRWFGRTFGSDESTGLHLPPLDRVAAAYGLSYVRLDGWERHCSLENQIDAVLMGDDPVLCEVPSPLEESRPGKPQSAGQQWAPVRVVREESS